MDLIFIKGRKKTLRKIAFIDYHLITGNYANYLHIYYFVLTYSAMSIHCIYSHFQITINSAFNTNFLLEFLSVLSPAFLDASLSSFFFSHKTCPTRLALPVIRCSPFPFSVIRCLKHNSKECLKLLVLSCDLANVIVTHIPTKLQHSLKPSLCWSSLKSWDPT